MDRRTNGGSLNEIKHGCSWKRSGKQSQSSISTFEGTKCIDPDKILYFYSDDTATRAIRSKLQAVLANFVLRCKCIGPIPRSAPGEEHDMGYYVIKR
jgi:hypothetical protein